jgi:transglutaminase-like putative cysteine protease
MLYSIRHITRFHYSVPISESVMEIRMQPRTENAAFHRQRCLSFDLAITPRARVTSHEDYQGNIVHSFDIPLHHSRLSVTARSVVEVHAPSPPPETLDQNAWEKLDTLVAEGDFWDMLTPSAFAAPTPLLLALADELGVGRRNGSDPMWLLRKINLGVHSTLDYVLDSTKVDSPIDDALKARQGVCQDYAHVMIALVRNLGIPCRYVSGYLFHRADSDDQSALDASHAWVEALLPGMGWVGFDPTNNLLVGDRHIRVAVGRDYADVPPSRGVFKGDARSTLDVAVQVRPADEALVDPELPSPAWRWRGEPVEEEINDISASEQQQQ